MNKIKHPYENFEDTPFWNVISKAISELVGNTDIEEKTRHEYIVGYIVKELSENIEGLPNNLFQRTAKNRGH